MRMKGSNVLIWLPFLSASLAQKSLRPDIRRSSLTAQSLGSSFHINTQYQIIFANVAHEMVCLQVQAYLRINLD